MQCPVCKKNLEAVTVEDITVDVCQNGCGGIWFDRFELQKVDEPHESAGEKLLNAQKQTEMGSDRGTQLHCPKCQDTPMMRHFFSVKKEVVVDECPKCAGFWLDYGELAAIRKQFDSEEERKKAAQAYFAEIFDVELFKMKAESEEKAEKAQKIARMFRFICPSYYLPGKQVWGAF